MKHLLIATIAAVAATAGEKQTTPTVDDVLQTYPAQLIKQELDQNEQAMFAEWLKGHKGTQVTTKARWDGGHSGGYCDAKIGGVTFPIHVEFVYTGKLPKKPTRQFIPRSTSCKNRKKTQHIKMTNTGREITITGTIMDIKPLLTCECGKPNIVTIKIKAESVK